MAIEVSSEVVIARPPGEVAAFVMNPTNDSTWIAAVREARLVDDQPISHGARIERTSRFLGRKVEQVLEVTQYTPPSRFVLDSVGGPVPMQVFYELDGLDDKSGGTRTRVRLKGNPGALFRLAKPLLKRIIQRTVSRDLAALKKHLESA